MWPNLLGMQPAFITELPSGLLTHPCYTECKQQGEKLNNDQKSSWFFLKFGGWLVLLAMLWFAVFGENGFIDLFKLHRTKQELETRVAEFERQNQALRDEIEALNDDDNKEVERLARENLGMVGDDEIMYQFKDGKEKTDSKQDNEN